jgi:hypothetical protein
MVCEAETSFASFEGFFPVASLSIPDFHCSYKSLWSRSSVIVGLIEAACLELPPLRASWENAMVPVALLPLYCTRFGDGCLAIVRFFLVCVTMPLWIARLLVALCGEEAGREMGQALSNDKHGLLGHLVGGSTAPPGRILPNW